MIHPTGAFSTCNGSVGSGSRAITCNGVDPSHGRFRRQQGRRLQDRLANNGTVSGSTVTGTFSVPAVGVNGATFTCKHTD